MAVKQLFERYRVEFSKIFLIILGIGLLFVGSEWEKTPLFGALLFFAAITLVGIGALGRLWCAIYISGYKDHTLVTSGPYALCRNPLYFFSMIGAVGVALATKTLSIPLVTLLLFAVYYPLVIKSEEMRLAAIHKDKFAAYCQTTPAFFPKRSGLKEPDEYLLRPVIFRKNLMDAIWFIWLLGILEIISSLHEANIIPTLLSVY